MFFSSTCCRRYTLCAQGLVLTGLRVPYTWVHCTLRSYVYVPRYACIIACCGRVFFKRHCYLHRLSLCSPDSAVDLHTPLVSSCTCSSIAPFAAKGARVVGAVSGVPASLLRAFVSIHGAVRLWKRHLIMTTRITHEKSSQGGSTNVDMYHVIIASIYPTPHYFILPRNFKRCVRQRSGPRPHRTNGIRHYFRRECRSRQGGQLQRARRCRCQGVLSIQLITQH